MSNIGQHANYEGYLLWQSLWGHPTDLACWLLARQEPVEQRVGMPRQHANDLRNPKPSVLTVCDGSGM